MDKEILACPYCGSENIENNRYNPDDHGMCWEDYWTCKDCGKKGFEPRNGKITNGDRIRAMSDEELAPLLTPRVMFCNGCPASCPENEIPTVEEADIFGAKTAKDICVSRVEKWLAQEAKHE